jgi:hypothetical protein
MYSIIIVAKSSHCNIFFQDDADESHIPRKYSSAFSYISRQIQLLHPVSMVIMLIIRQEMTKQSFCSHCQASPLLDVSSALQYAWRIVTDCQGVQAARRGYTRIFHLLGGTGLLFYYDTISIYHCLAVCAQNMSLVQLCHSAMRKLYGEKFHIAA